jgi:hypothetical protein
VTAAQLTELRGSREAMRRARFSTTSNGAPAQNAPGGGGI